MSITYNIYANTGIGDPINYGSPIATVSSLSYTTSTLAAGSWAFGVRAQNANGEEQNLDCAVSLAIDAEGHNISNIPAPPIGLRAFATAGGGVRVEWYYPETTGLKAPAGFHVYTGTGGVPNYSIVKATVGYTSGVYSTFQANLTGLTDGTQYTVGCRTYNASGEEANTSTVAVTADATGPAAVDSLTAVATV